MTDTPTAIRLPNDVYVIATSHERAAEVQRIIDARHRFNLDYCAAKGWPTDPARLTFDQIMEIRAQDGWKNAGKDGQP